MREARAREFALGIGKGDGICSRHGAMIEVVHGRIVVMKVVQRLPSRETIVKIIPRGRRIGIKARGNQRVTCKESLTILLLRTYTILIILSRRIEIKKMHGTPLNAMKNVDSGGSHTKRPELMKLSFVRTRSSQASKRRLLILSRQ